MDLVYMNADKQDIGVLKDYTFDLAFGADENNFECKVSIDNNVCSQDYYLYYEDSEYGGIIDTVEVDTENRYIIYKGRTWQGILASKIVQPDVNQDYYKVNGRASYMLETLIARLGLDQMFTVSVCNTQVNYQFARYVDAYTGITKMLKSSNLKLKLIFRQGFVHLGVEDLKDYSEDEEFDQDQLALTLTKAFNPVNHVICLGKGDLKDRRVFHIYADEQGNISGSPSMKYMQEVAAVYDDSNAEDDEDLIEGGIDLIKDSWAESQIEYSFNSNDSTYDIGDIIGGYERITDTRVRAEITKKIVKIQKGIIDISYECEGLVADISTGPFYYQGNGSSANNIAYSTWFVFDDRYNGDLYADIIDTSLGTTFSVDENGNVYVDSSTSKTFLVNDKNDIFCE